MGNKESVEAAAKLNADGWGHMEVSITDVLESNILKH